jgi:hypothetical protein
MQTVRKLPQFLPQLPSRWLDFAYGPADATPGERALRWLTFAVVVFGIWLRCRGLWFGSTLALWNDEAQWAVMLETEPLTHLFIRPIAFMALTKAIVAVFGAAELSFRFLPWLGGFATSLLAPTLARRLFDSSAARFLMVAVIALHPSAIDLARDFKPYSLGLSFHLGVAVLALDYLKARTARKLWLTLGLAMLGVLFAQDIIFVYPGLFLVLSLAAYRDKNRAQLLGIAASAAATIGILLGLYFAIWQNLDRESERSYWGARYDVFYMADSGRDSSYFGWLGRQYAEVAAMPGTRREHYEAAATPETPPPVRAQVDKWLWFAIHVAGVAVLLRRRRLHECLLLFGPLLVLIFFNAVGRWPFGAFRTNLFLLAYVTPIAGFAFEPKRLAGRVPALLPGLALVLVPFFALNKHFHTYKHSFAATSYYPDAIARLLDLQLKDRHGEGPELLVLDTRTCAGFRYYTRYHPMYESRRAEIDGRFQVKCGKSTRRMLMKARSGAVAGQRVWGIATGERQREELDWRMPGYRVFTETRLGGEQILIGVEKT